MRKLLHESEPSFEPPHQNLKDIFHRPMLCPMSCPLGPDPPVKNGLAPAERYHILRATVSRFWAGMNLHWTACTCHWRIDVWKGNYTMASSNGDIFRVTGPLCGEFTGPGEFPTQRPVTRSFDVFFDLRLNKLLNKQPWGWWFETPSSSLWRQCNENISQCTGSRLNSNYERIASRVGSILDPWAWKEIFQSYRQGRY